MTIYLNMDGHFPTITKVTDIMPATSILYKKQKFLPIFFKNRLFYLYPPSVFLISCQKLRFQCPFPCCIHIKCNLQNPILALYHISPTPGEVHPHLRWIHRYSAYGNFLRHPPLKPDRLLTAHNKLLPVLQVSHNIFSS